MSHLGANEEAVRAALQEAEPRSHASQQFAALAARSMGAKQDDALAHVAHAFGCQTCIDHGNENLHLAVRLQKLRKRNRKLKKRLREATGSP